MLEGMMCFATSNNVHATQCPPRWHKYKSCCALCTDTEATEDLCHVIIKGDYRNILQACGHSTTNTLHKDMFLKIFYVTVNHDKNLSVCGW